MLASGSASADQQGAAWAYAQDAGGGDAAGACRGLSAPRCVRLPDRLNLKCRTLTAWAAPRLRLRTAEPWAPKRGSHGRSAIGVNTIGVSNGCRAHEQGA